MKLVAFSIQNYRSIIHSGWSNLAHDNITALIGQNESGKTSILEALYSFYTGTILEDVLRSDLTLPIVHCRFEIENRTLSDLIVLEKIPIPLREVVAQKSIFSLSRKWKQDRSSSLFISDSEILAYFDVLEKDRLKLEEQTQLDINELLTESERIFNSIQEAEMEKNESQKALVIKRKELDESKKKLNKARTPDVRLFAENDFESIQNEYVLIEERYRNSVENFEESKARAQEISEKVSTCRSCNNAIQEFLNLTVECETLRHQVKETSHLYEVSISEKDQRNVWNKLQQLNNQLQAFETRCDSSEKKASLQKNITAKVLAGKKFKQAEADAYQEIELNKQFYNLFELGEALVKYIPEFEFFEDFSSLLPNKIDLEDILNENSLAEGYKAARNFLHIAGLNAEFFREKNHRILKQKIENLNGEITINFQDYWSQNVGRNSKIRLNFELEHYDYTHPEKSGKPYLEFWIKDTQERLYPKQRSRGVRWFLSFYLELKATAKQNHISRVLLIDEPGLSLHAKAQEDVLKVFEDLKDKMQIIYCTHSPHLIDTHKLYRILAVQRVNEEDDQSETMVLDSNSLYSASSDTLSPVYSLMGVKINSQNFIQPINNVIVEDTITYYYLNAIYRLVGEKLVPSFIPSTGLTNIPIISNILMGWKIKFSVLLMGNSRTLQMNDELLKTAFFAEVDGNRKKILRFPEFEYPEDIFSTLDFKKFLLQKREGITEKNSEYIINNGLSRTIIASQFLNFCEDKKLSVKDFDEDTNRNIKLLIDRIKTVLN